MNLRDNDDRTVAAGEYVLGTLGADERREFERSLARDAALQAEVYAWQDRLLPLAVRAVLHEPISEGWTAIELDSLNFKHDCYFRRSTQRRARQEFRPRSDRGTVDADLGRARLLLRRHGSGQAFVF
ncbi:MAG: hypothetical protein H0V63_09870, partial [Burkholderiaceae bacterium]|nr:hypothetical protein [Burkholderiaceae bacterium]